LEKINSYGQGGKLGHHNLVLRRHFSLGGGELGGHPIFLIPRKKESQMVT